MYFEKYHGTGNDFILVKENVLDPVAFAKKVCDRHMGIGADGFMYPTKSSIADIKMNYYNHDGSIAKMCGNGIRCFARFVYEHKLVNQKNFYIETLDGIKEVWLFEDEVKVKLDLPKLDGLDSRLNKVIDGLTPYMFQDVKGYILTIGTMHAVIYEDENPLIDTHLKNEVIQNDLIFKDQTNVNFVKKLNEHRIFVKTFERGAGWTLSCGTGATASAYHAFKHQVIVENEIEVLVPGGLLRVIIENDHTYLIGPATKIIEGNI